jgi:hypothetical protein
MCAAFVSLKKIIKRLDSKIYLMILILYPNINIFYKFSQSCFSGNENGIYFRTEGVFSNQQSTVDFGGVQTEALDGFRISNLSLAHILIEYGQT